MNNVDSLIEDLLKEIEDLIQEYRAKQCSAPATLLRISVAMMAATRKYRKATNS